MAYECAWCGQAIRKGMECGAIWDRSACYWAGAVKRLGVRGAIKESRQRKRQHGYTISDNAITSDRETDGDKAVQK